MWWLILLLVVAVFLIGFRLYLSPPTRWCKSQRCLVGKTIVITGANTGIGFLTALDFAKRGGRIILACRDKAKGEEARSEIIEKTDNTNIFVKLVDMSSFESVRCFVKELYETEERLDILVNNAGISYYGHNQKTNDGQDFVMQVNYYSHFLVTVLLIDLMKKSNQPSRIVNTSSLAAAYANNFDINNLDKLKSYYDPYANSKLCNILFTKELAKRLQNTKITTYSLHPGAIKTGIFRNTTSLARFLIQVIVTLFYKGLEEGAQTTIYCSLEKDLEQWSGHHFDNCRRVRSSYKTARDPSHPGKLWQVTERIVGLKEVEKLKYPD